MHENILKHLDLILVHYQDRLRKAASQAKEQRLAEQRFLEAFPQVRETIIHPVLETFQAYLRQRGHEGMIVGQTSINAHMAVDILGSLYIALIVYRADIPQDAYQRCDGEDISMGTDVPQVRFAADVTRQQVVVWISGMVPGAEGRGYRAGWYSLEEITSTFVERTLVTGIEEIFDPIPGYMQQNPQDSEKSLRQH